MEEHKSTAESSQEIERLKKENARLSKRLDRITDQGDRQHKQFEKLNEHLQNYIDIIDDHIITVNIDNKLVIRSVSTAFSNAFGFTPDEVLGKEYDFLLHNEDTQRFRIEIVELEATKLPWHGELKHMTKAESFLWTSSIITPVYDEDSKEVVEYTIISKNITEEKQLQELKSSKLSNKEYSQSMLEFMGSKSSALLQRASKNFSYTLWLLLAAITWFLIWANYAEIDELARGSGKIIPSMQIQKVQSTDEGRIEKIFVKEGSFVKKGDLLFKLNDIDSASTFAQNSLRLDELRAKENRLYAQAYNLPFKPDKGLLLKNPQLIEHERSLYLSNVKQHGSKIDAMKEQKIQQENALLEAKEKFRRLHANFNLLDQEIEIKKGLLEDKIISKVEYLQLGRQKNELLLEINTVEKEITKTQSGIAEIRSNIRVAKLEVITQAKRELNDIYPEIERLQKSQTSLWDHVNRTSIYAPVEGTINNVNVTTEGEVVKAGKVLADIVPLEDSLIAEVRVSPSDIAFLKLHQESMVKFSSYDFGIYGGLKGKIVYISADTIVDKSDGRSYYTVHIKTDKNSLGTEEKPLLIKVGMVTDVDILLGKKSVMDYILKPIMKAKHNALSER